MTKRNEHSGSDPFNPSAFSLSDFKKWMHNQHRDKPLEEQLLGLRVEPKIGLSKLLTKMECEDDDHHVLALEFRKKGGTVVDTEGHNLMIEVDSGNFVIASHYVRRRD